MLMDAARYLYKVDLVDTTRQLMRIFITNLAQYKDWVK